MTTVKTYPTFISHNPHGYARASAISLSKNEVTYEMRHLPADLQAKLYGVIGWINLTVAELRQINNVRNSVYRVGDTMMENLLKSK